MSFYYSIFLCRVCYSEILKTSFQYPVLSLVLRAWRILKVRSKELCPAHVFIKTESSPENQSQSSYYGNPIPACISDSCCVCVHNIFKFISICRFHVLWYCFLYGLCYGPFGSILFLIWYYFLSLIPILTVVIIKQFWFYYTNIYMI